MKLLRFERSRTRNKKYDAILVDDSGKEKRLAFGDNRNSCAAPAERRDQQYRDSTGLGLYSQMDHLDTKRRELYRKRHAGEASKKYSAGYLAWKYLWT